MSNSPIVHAADAKEHEHLYGKRWGGYYKVLTPTMRERGGTLGVNLSRCPPGRALVPFHSHALEDEVFYILSGVGVLRYGDDTHPLVAGDCVSCPAGTGIAHQIANTGDEDLVYLAIGRNDPNEVCHYPDSGKVMVRSLRTVGVLEKTEYMHGEAEEPKVFQTSSLP
jgi:uncharacterized cupin superfamily protein